MSCLLLWHCYFVLLALLQCIKLVNLADEEHFRIIFVVLQNASDDDAVISVYFVCGDTCANNFCCAPANTAFPTLHLLTRKGKMPYTTNLMERELKKQEKAKREEQMREQETLRKKEAEEAAAKAAKEAAEAKAKLDAEWKEKQRRFFALYRRAKQAEPKVIADEEVFANRHGLIINRSVLATTYQSTVYPAKRVAPKIGGSPAPQPDDPAESSMVVRVTVLEKCYTDYRKHLLAESLKLAKYLGTPEPLASAAAGGAASPSSEILALRHPALVRVFDTFVSEKKAYMFMEQLSTISLSALIKVDPGLSLDDTQTFGRQICDALNFLNRLGLAHLNVRSDNILWNEGKQQMKLSGPSRLFVCWDVDLEAKILHPRINNHNYVDHFPPEVVGKGADFDPSLVDVYSFAALLHQMLVREKLFVRQMPFHGTESTKELWEGHLLERKEKLKRVPESAMALLKQIVPVKAEERPSLQQVLQCAFFSATQEAIEAEISAPKVAVQ